MLRAKPMIGIVHRSPHERRTYIGAGGTNAATARERQFAQARPEDRRRGRSERAARHDRAEEPRVTVAELEHELIRFRFRICARHRQLRSFASCRFGTDVDPRRRSWSEIEGAIGAGLRLRELLEDADIRIDCEPHDRALDGLSANTTLPAIMRGLMPNCASHTGTSSIHCEARRPSRACPSSSCPFVELVPNVLEQTVKPS